MKKLLALILASLMIFAFVSCGNTENNETTDTSSTANTSGSEATGSETTGETTGSEETTGKPEDPEASDITSALDLLNKIWASYEESELFAIIGGDEMTMDAPGAVDPSNTEIMNSKYCVSADSAALTDGAASIIHMMNANLFTCGAYHLKNSADVETFASGVKDSILGTQWICGFPDKVMVISIDDYVIAVFGNEDMLETFKTKTLTLFDGAEILYDEPLA